MYLACEALCFALLSGLALLAVLQSAPLETASIPLAMQAADASAESNESVKADRPTDFQPGIQIDWDHATVLLAGRVVLRDAPLEFLACFRGKEHESIIRLTSQATHVFMALGLIGLEPSKENQPEALCSVRLRWEEDGQIRECDGHEWLESRQLAQVAIPRAMRFTGSQQRPNGTVAAADSGAGIAIVSMPDALLEPTDPRSSQNAELWARARTEAIPPKDTPVTVLVSPAKPLKLDLRIDPRGLVWANERIVDQATLVDLLRQHRWLTRQATIQMRDWGALRADRRRLLRGLKGLPDVPQIEFVAAASQNPAETP